MVSRRTLTPEDTAGPQILKKTWPHPSKRLAAACNPSLLSWGLTEERRQSRQTRGQRVRSRGLRRPCGGWKTPPVLHQSAPVLSGPRQQLPSSSRQGRRERCRARVGQTARTLESGCDPCLKCHRSTVIMKTFTECMNLLMRVPAVNILQNSLLLSRYRRARRQPVPHTLLFDQTALKLFR